MALLALTLEEVGDRERSQRSEIRGQTSEGRLQLAAELSSHRASRHVPSASLSQDAALSFVVRGRGQVY